MHPTRRGLAGFAAVLALGAGRAAARGEAGPELLNLYLRFADAQNRRDLARVRALLWESPDFLWVSDGRAFWGPEALIERMGAFQKAEVWRVEPAIDRARAVEVAEDAAYLSMPLTLVIGPSAGPSRLSWLVGVLCRRQRDGWRIAALFTTEDKGA